jgi:hypothetical protein
MKINIHNYETYFLSYIDNELTTAEKNEVEIFLKENPNYASEMALLKKAILMPTKIIYEDKALLYRHQAMEASLSPAFKQNLYRKEAPVVKGYFSGTRMRSITAIAALLLVFIGYQWFSPSEDATLGMTPQNSIARNSNTDFSKNESKIGMALQRVKTAENKRAINTLSKNSSLIKSTITNSTITTQAQDYANVVADNNFIIAENDTRNALASMDKTNSIAPAATNIDPMVNTANVIPSEETKTETAVSYEEYNTDNADRGIYIANLEIDGDKLRGLGRRFNALIRKNKNR